jgi:hypothetical protein
MKLPEYLKMTDHFRFYPSSDEITIPWNARYSFPSQANKAVKITPRIPPKNGATFLPGQTIRLEFPAQGYVNTANLTFEMDVRITPNNGTLVGTSEAYIRFQNNIQSIFTRVRLLYGSTPLEDIVNYNVIARMLTEWTSSSGVVADQTSVADGIGGINSLSNVDVSTRNSIHGYHTVGTSAFFTPNSTLTRRYQFTLALGLTTQGKLLPTKFMASQLAIELTCAKETDCLIAVGRAGTSTTDLVLNPTYQVSNVNMIPEILEFDASYDNMFLKGLQEGGVPIKFSSWHTYQFSHPGGSTANILIQERSRSVKSIYTVLRRQTSTFNNDAGALFQNLEVGQQLESFQYRIGGRYFPASPVQVSTNSYDIGSAEAFIELEKALHTVGDSRLSTNVSMLNWGPRYVVPTGVSVYRPSTTSEADYSTVTSAANSLDVVTAGYYASVLLSSGVPSVYTPSACFCMATCLETTSGMEISGLNAEEQSDISLNIKWSGPAPAAGVFVIETYVFYDAMIVLRENNVLELIQ